MIFDKSYSRPKKKKKGKKKARPTTTLKGGTRPSPTLLRLFSAFVDKGELSHLTGGESKVLMALIRHADYATRIAFPSIELLAHETGQHPGSVSNQLRELAERGIIKTVQKGGQGRSTRRKLFLEHGEVPNSTKRKKAKAMKKKKKKKRTSHPDMDTTHRRVSKTRRRINRATSNDETNTSSRPHKESPSNPHPSGGGAFCFEAVEEKAVRILTAQYGIEYESKARSAVRIFLSKYTEPDLERVYLLLKRKKRDPTINNIGDYAIWTLENPEGQRMALNTKKKRGKPRVLHVMYE